MTHKTLKSAMNTNVEPVILHIEDYEFMGQQRKSIKARKAKGKKVYTIIQYESGNYSEAV